MRFTFPPNGQSVPVVVNAFGPRQFHAFTCTLDTGAERTLLPAAVLRRLGCDFNRPVGRARIRGATGSVMAPLIRLPVLTALGHARRDFVVAAHDFPIGVETNGLLGLDFYRGLILKLDFARGRAQLDAPSWWRFWR